MEKSKDSLEALENPEEETEDSFDMLDEPQEPESTLNETIQESHQETIQESTVAQETINISAVPVEETSSSRATAMFYNEEINEQNSSYRKARINSIKEEMEERDQEYQLSIEDFCSDEDVIADDNPSKKTRDQIMKQIFSEPQNSILERAARESEESQEVFMLLKNYVVDTFIKLSNEIEPRFKSEQEKYNQYLKKLKSPQDNDKIDFYHKKLKSMRTIYCKLYAELEKISNEIVARKNDPDLLEKDHEVYAKRLDVALARLDTRLPIYFKKDEIMHSLTHNRVTAIIGKPGCGKSTQIPSLLLEAGLVNSQDKKMYMVTPRQVAAIQILKRVIEELNESEKQTNCNLISSTDFVLRQDKALNFSTDTEFYKRMVVGGEIKVNQMGYLIIDEANSKKMYTDVMLSVSRKLLKNNPNLKLVLLCTEFDKEYFNEYFRGVIELKGNNTIEIVEENYLTEVIYDDRNGDMEKKTNDALKSIEEIIYRMAKRTKRNGKAIIRDANILMFVSCAKECQQIMAKFQWLHDKPGLLCDRVQDLGLKTKYKVYMASGSNSSSLDEELFKEGECTQEIKLIFSTKVLETSLTIPNIGFVVDFGTEVLYSYDFQIGADKTIAKRISKNTADQRKGRVGRTGRGVCIRMYSQDEYNVMERSSESELMYKNIDELVLSWVRVVLQAAKENSKSPYFDLEEPKKPDSEFSTTNDIEEVLSSYIMAFELISPLNQEAVIESLRLMRWLKMIDGNTMRDGETQLYSVILGLGVGPRLGKAIYEAITMGRKSKEKLRPWVLGEIIDVVASNAHTRAVAHMSLAKSVEGKQILDDLLRKSRQYGDYYFNYTIFKWYKEKSTKIAEIGAYKSTLRKFDEMRYQLRGRCRKLLSIQEAFFNDNSVEKHNISEEEKFNAITECLISGYMPELSKFISRELGYYHVRIGRLVQFGYGSVLRNRDETPMNVDMPRYVIMADVVQSDYYLESRFCVPVKEEILRKKTPNIFKNFESIPLDDIMSQIYCRDDLSSEVSQVLYYRSYYLDQILGESGQTMKRTKNTSALLMLAIKPRDFAAKKREVDSVIEYIHETVTNSTYELCLKDFRVTIGNGLKISDILCGLESISFYFFMVPRYLDNNMVKPKNSCCTIGPWDFLVKDFKKYFGLEGLNFNAETTFTKVNYGQSSPFMNLKITCADSTTKNTVLEKIEAKRSIWYYDPAYGFQISEIKMYDKMLNKDPNNKMLHAGIIFSLAKNKGTAMIKSPSLLGQDKIKEKLDEMFANKESPDNIFGPHFTIEVVSSSSKRSAKSFILRDIPRQLDEMRILAFFQDQDPKYRMFFNAITVDMAKEDFEKEPDRSKLIQELEKMLRSLIDKKLPKSKDTIHFSFAPFKDVFYKYKEFKKMKEIEVKTNSGEFVKTIIDTLHKKRDPDFHIGQQYTHVIRYDRPEFHVKKRIFTKIETLINNLNDDIEAKVRDKYRKAPHTDDLDMKVNAEKSYIKVYKEKIQAINDNENIKLEIIKGDNKEVASRLERVLREYFNGKEIFIKEDYYSFFFGTRGKEFLNQLKNKNEYVIITPIELKSIWVVQEIIRDNSKSVQEQIEEKFKELDQRSIRYLHFKISEKEASRLSRSTTFSTFEQKIRSEFKSGKVYTSKGFYSMVIVESEKADAAQVEKISRAFLQDFRNSLRNEVKVKPVQIEQEFEEEEEDAERIPTDQDWHCERCNDTGNVRRLHLCGHIFCSTCLQNHCFETLNAYQSGDVRDLNQPLIFCSSKGCGKEISAADLFRILPDSRLEHFVTDIVNDMMKYGALPSIVRCKECNYFHKVANKSTPKASLSCAKCHKPL